MMAIRYGAGPTIRAISASDISFVRHSTPIPTITSEPSTTTVTTKDRAVITAQSATYYRDWDLRADIYIDKNNALARGQFVCLDTDVADFVGSVLTRKANGAARVNYETQIGTWQDSYDVSETVDDVDVDYAYAVGSLARHITDAITALATGHTAGDMPQYSTRDDSTATYVRNPSCWTASLDTTGLSVWNSLGRQHRAGVAISPRHTLHALHYPVTVGTVLRFVASDNSVVTRTVDAVYGVPQATAYQKDLQIARLDSDLPGAIKPMKFLPANAGDYLATWDQPYLYVIGTNARKQSICALSRLSVVVPPTISVTISSTREEPYAALYTPIIVGDSGSPIILPINGEAVLIGHWTFATAGPAHHLLLTDITSAMTALGGGYSPSVVDLSSFPTY